METLFLNRVSHLAFFSFLCLSLSCLDREKSPAENHKNPLCPFFTEEGRVFSTQGIHLFRGINVAQSLKDPPFTQGVTEGDLRRIRDLGMNAIRFLIFYRAVEPEPGKWDEGYLESVQGFLDLAYHLKIRVILDMHQDLYGGPFLPHGNPTWSCPESEGVGVEFLQPWFLNYLNPVVGECFQRFFTDEERIEKFSKMWQVVARRFADHPALLGFELLNEPFPGSLPPLEFDEEILARWVERIGTAIREVAPCTLILFEPSVLGSNIGLPSRMRPVQLSNLIYAPHLYLAETEGGAPYRRRSPGFFEELLRVKLQEAFRHHAGIFIGEWGNVGEWGEANPDSAEALIADFLASAESLLISSFYWEIGGLFQKDRTLRAFARAFIRPTLELYQGEILEYRYSMEKRELFLRLLVQKGDILEFLLPKGMRLHSLSLDSFSVTEEEERVTLVYQGSQKEEHKLNLRFSYPF